MRRLNHWPTLRASVLPAVMAIAVVVFLIGPAIAGPKATPGAAPAPDQARAETITKVSPPRPMPELHFVDDDGHPMTLRDFQDRAVLLNLWATWCVPCRQEMPSLDRLQAKLGGPRFHVLAVSIDKQGAAVVQPFYRELGLRSLAIYLDPSGKAPPVLGIEGVPATLLIDTDGREIGRKLGALEWDSPAAIAALRQAFGLRETP